MDTQCSKYFIAAMGRGREVGGVLYDVLRKSAIRPKFVADVDPLGFKIVVDAQGNRVFTANGKKPRETEDKEKGWLFKGHTETPDEFEARMLATMREDRFSYFAQRDVPRLESDLKEYMKDQWQLSQQIQYFQRHDVWPRNPQACKEYGTCEFLEICTGRAVVDGIRFRVRPSQHPELKMTFKVPLLTNSRGNALRKCARFHRLRYEDKIERVDETPEALAFGTLVHVGLEALFNWYKNFAGKSEE
jgi:hypothetical protein